MWPFSRRTRFQLPPWTFQSVDGDHSILSLSLGRWFATDGAHLTSDSIELGSVTTNVGFLDLVRTSDGLASLTITCQAEIRENHREEDTLVIDSGCMFLCCEGAFKLGGLDLNERRTSYSLDRAAQKACPGKKAVLLLDAEEQCIGIVAVPMWGDGIYRLHFRKTGELQVFEVSLEDSC